MAIKNAVDLTGLKQDEIELILRLYLAQEKFFGKKPEFNPNFEGFGVLRNKFPIGTIKRLLAKAIVENSSISAPAGGVPAGIRLTPKGLAMGLKIRVEPESRFEKVLGYPVRFERRAYGRGAVYTWAEVMLDPGNWVSLGDPWPGAKWPEQVLQHAVTSMIGSVVPSPGAEMVQRVASRAMERMAGGHGRS